MSWYREGVENVKPTDFGTGQSKVMRFYIGKEKQGTGKETIFIFLDERGFTIKEHQVKQGKRWDNF